MYDRGKFIDKAWSRQERLLYLNPDQSLTLIGDNVADLRDTVAIIPKRSTFLLMVYPLVTQAYIPPNEAMRPKKNTRRNLKIA